MKKPEKNYFENVKTNQELSKILLGAFNDLKDGKISIAESKAIGKQADKIMREQTKKLNEAIKNGDKTPIPFFER